MKKHDKKKSMRQLNSGYEARSGRIDKNRWHQIITKFDDSSLYQTYSYEAIRRRHNDIDHIILTYDKKIVAAAQARIIRIPLLNTGIAYVRWGPLWKVSGEKADIEVFRQAIRAIRNEYTLRRRMMLRIVPAEYQKSYKELHSVLCDEGFIIQKRRTSERTLLVDISISLSEIRKNFRQKWRNCLNNAEKRQLDLIEGEDNCLFEIFMGVYRELLNRKMLEEPQNIIRFRMIQEDLPQELKMRIFLSRSHDGIGAGAICSAIGTTGIYMFGATNSLGMATKGSYLVQWRVIQWLKEKGCTMYDLNGINPVRNPGTYHFKAGIAGLKGKDIFFLGKYDSYSTILAHFLSTCGEPLVWYARRLSSFVKKMLV